jgi:large subunit ribosomal protein L9
MKQIKTIGFDADDTLWYNERFFGEAQTALKVLLQKYADEKVVADANSIAEVISNLDIKVKAKVAEDGQKLFGSVTTIQFTDALEALGHEIDKRFVKLITIKEVGKYEAEVRLHRSVSVTVPFEVIAE